MIEIKGIKQSEMFIGVDMAYEGQEISYIYDDKHDKIIYMMEKEE